MQYSTIQIQQTLHADATQNTANINAYIQIIFYIKLLTIEAHCLSRDLLAAAFTAENLPANSAMMPSSKGIKFPTTFIAFFAMLIWHPVLLEVMFEVTRCL